VLIGIVLGLAVAVVLGVGIYHGSKRIDMRRFFMVTGVLIVLFAAGLAAKAVQFFQAAGDLGSVNWAVYDVTGINWLTINTQFGRFLAGIFGWDPRPSLEQVVVYLAFLLPVGAGYLRATRRPKVAPPVQGPPVEAPQHTAA